MSDDGIMVSICCLVYNHEKYLRQCLDGFMMQKTNFAFEVLIHDDASTDNSALIIKEYQKKYPNIIKPVYQTDNKYSKGEPITWKYQFPRAKGKYIALCEGDDYWIDDNKLQKQFDTLESACDVVMCVHKVLLSKEDGTSLGRFIPDNGLEISDLNSDEVIKMAVVNSCLFQTSSYFFRRSIIEQFIIDISSNNEWNDNRPEFMKLAPVGDLPLLLLLSTNGDIVFLNETMSVYRTESLGSWSVRNKSDKAYYYNNMIALKKMLRCFDEFTNRRYHKEIDYRCLNIEFRWYEDNGFFRSLFKKKYRSILHERSTKEQIYLLIVALFPAFDTFYPILKKVLKSKASQN